MRQPDITEQEIYTSILDHYPIGTPHPLRDTLPPEARESSWAEIQAEEALSLQESRKEELELLLTGNSIDISLLDEPTTSKMDIDAEEDEVENDVSVIPFPTIRHTHRQHHSLAEPTLVLPPCIIVSVAFYCFT